MPYLGYILTGIDFIFYINLIKTNYCEALMVCATIVGVKNTNIQLTTINNLVAEIKQRELKKRVKIYG